MRRWSISRMNLPAGAKPSLPSDPSEPTAPMSSRSSKKRKPGPKLGHRKPPPENDSLAAHYEVVDVLWTGLRRMEDFQREASKTDDGLRTRSALIVDWSDRLGRAFYQHKIGGEMPTVAGEVMVFDAPFDIVMDAAAEFYRPANHVEPPVGPGQVRAIVLTLGTMTVFRLERDDTPVQWNPLHVSDSYTAKRGDVLLVALAAWRSDRAEDSASASSSTRGTRATPSPGASSSTSSPSGDPR